MWTRSATFCPQGDSSAKRKGSSDSGAGQRPASAPGVGKGGVGLASGQANLGWIPESESSLVLSLGGGFVWPEDTSEAAGRLFRVEHNTWRRVSAP